MDMINSRTPTCSVYSLVLLIACGHIASAQTIYQENPINTADFDAILRIILNRAPIIDRAAAQTQAPTTTTTTKKAEQLNYLNDDGSVNRFRQGLLPFQASTPKPADRNGQSPVRSILDILLRRYPQTTVKPTVNGYRSYDQTSAPAAPAAPETSSPSTKRNGALVVTNGGVYIVNNGSGRTPSTKEEKIDIQDKPYTSVPGDFFDSKTRSK